MVNAVAVIMIAVFAARGRRPLIKCSIGSSEQMVKMIGFGLAIAVFFDAFVVRMAIVPAVLALLGHRAWWLPRWLDRVLPKVDVEGDKLRTGDDTAAGPAADPDAERELVRV